jgi:toxin ParE1/3/4
MRFGDLPRRPLSDVLAIIDHYLREADNAVALRFADALEQAMRHIAEHPESGSPRLEKETGIKGLRVWPVKGFSYVILYRVMAGKVTFARVLRTSRDIPATLQD